MTDRDQPIDVSTAMVAVADENFRTAVAYDDGFEFKPFGDVEDKVTRERIPAKEFRLRCLAQLEKSTGRPSIEQWMKLTGVSRTTARNDLKFETPFAPESSTAAALMNKRANVKTIGKPLSPKGIQQTLNEVSESL